MGGHFIWRPKSKPHKLLACIEARVKTFLRQNTSNNVKETGAKQ